MDHDNKVKIQKPEVKLFLPENLYPVTKSTPQIYDLEEEYAKTKKNRSPFIALFMAGLCLFVGALTFGVTKYIDYKNKQITVGIDVFEDLNLIKLLDMVSRTEDSLKSARAEKARLEVYRDTAVSDLESKRDADLYTLSTIPLKSAEKKTRENVILTEFEKNREQILSDYAIQIASVDQQIADITKQLEGLDSTRVQQAQEQQAAIDSQRQIFEIEKQEIIQNYETMLRELQTKLNEQQRSTLASQMTNLDSLSGDYRDIIMLLDPVISDEQGQAILEETALYEQNEVYNAEDFFPEGADQRYKDLLLQIEGAYEGFSYLTDVVLSVPHENSLPSYVAAMKKIAYLIGLNLSENAAHALSELQDTLEKQEKDYEKIIKEGKAYISQIEQENEAQSSQITALENEILTREEANAKIIKDAEQQISTLKAEKKFLEGRLSLIETDRSVLQSAVKFFDEMSNQNGDAGYVLNTDNKSKILVYISPLFQSSADNANAYVFRKADELIGTVSLVSSDGYFYAIPDSDDIAAKIRPNDRVLLNLFSE